MSSPGHNVVMTPPVCPTISREPIGYNAYLIVDNGTRVIRLGWRLASEQAMGIALRAADEYTPCPCGFVECG